MNEDYLSLLIKIWYKEKKSTLNWIENVLSGGRWKIKGIVRWY